MERSWSVGSIAAAHGKSSVQLCVRRQKHAQKGERVREAASVLVVWLRAVRNLSARSASKLPAPESDTPQQQQTRQRVENEISTVRKATSQTHAYCVATVAVVALVGISAHRRGPMRHKPLTALIRDGALGCKRGGGTFHKCRTCVLRCRECCGECWRGVRGRLNHLSARTREPTSWEATAC